jgi:prefoldin alpha subunit
MTDLSKQIDLITSRLSEQLETLETEYARWNNYKNDYDALEQQLKTLPEETKRSAMIPVGKLAFMPGTIIHTNEILVLLGEQYFAERSAKQALDILHRRKEGRDIAHYLNSCI